MEAALLRRSSAAAALVEQCFVDPRLQDVHGFSALLWAKWSDCKGVGELLTGPEVGMALSPKEVQVCGFLWCLMRQLSKCSFPSEPRSVLVGELRNWGGSLEVRFARGSTAKPRGEWRPMEVMVLVSACSTICKPLNDPQQLGTNYQMIKCITMPVWSTMSLRVPNRLGFTPTRTIRVRRRRSSCGRPPRSRRTLRPFWRGPRPWPTPPSRPDARCGGRRRR